MKPKPIEEPMRPLYLRLCLCGNIHNWRLIKNLAGKVIEAICADCGRTYKK